MADYGSDFPCENLIGLSSTTPLKFKSSPLKRDHPKRKVVFQSSFFRGDSNFRGCIYRSVICSFFFPEVSFILIYSMLWNVVVSLVGG